MPRKAWEEWEDEYLQVNTGVKTHKEIGIYLGRSKCSVSHRIERLGLCAGKIQKFKRSDFLNKTFYKLTVLDTYETNTLYCKCKCECGNIVTVKAHQLLSGNNKSCGCFKLEKTIERNKARRKNFTQSGQKFGRLTVTVPDIKPYHSQCVCECGTITVCSNDNLLSGRTQSCGCIKSSGETTIKNLLMLYQIPFKHQYYKIDLPNGNYVVPDFRIGPYYIEYHGIQHYESVTRFGGQERFIAQQKRDQLLRDTLGDKLIEVPYTIPFDKIEQYLRDEFAKRGIDIFGEQNETTQRT